MRIISTSRLSISGCPEAVIRGVFLLDLRVIIFFVVFRSIRNYRKYWQILFLSTKAEGKNLLVELILEKLRKVSRGVAMPLARFLRISRLIYHLLAAIWVVSVIQTFQCQLLHL